MYHNPLHGKGPADELFVVQLPKDGESVTQDRCRPRVIAPLQVCPRQPYLHVREAAPVTDLASQYETFLVKRYRRRVLTLVQRHRSQVVQCHGDAASLSQLPVPAQRLLGEGPSRLEVPD